jgi:hypothetical protein
MRGFLESCAGRGDMRHFARCYSLLNNIVSIALIRTYILLTGTIYLSPSDPLEKSGCQVPQNVWLTTSSGRGGVAEIKGSE